MGLPFQREDKGRTGVQAGVVTLLAGLLPTSVGENKLSQTNLHLPVLSFKMTF